MSFELLKTDPSGARRGVLHLPHGDVQTPIFMPVGTQGTVKTLHPEDLEALGAQIILGNTYHLCLRPGDEAIRNLGGLHTLSGWDKPILTDSGGFQVWSLARLRKITEEGVRFCNHIDGAYMMLSPERSMEIQANLGSDIAMLFDECPPYPCDRKYAEKSLGYTLRWAKRCKAWIDEHQPMSGNGRQQHFGIVQGSVYADLRRRCAEELAAMDFDGYAIGGVSVGEPEEEMLRAIDNSAPWLPQNKARYAMGLGTPIQLLEMIERGVDMFDCVMPTRNGRNGQIFTSEGTINLRNKKWENDFSPLDPNGASFVDRLYSKAYVHHLVVCKEMLAAQIASLHNIAFYLWLVGEARKHIIAGDYAEWKRVMVEKLGRRL